MEKAVLDCVYTLEMGEMRSYRNLAVLPLFSPLKGGPSYVTMKEALEAGTLKVTELGKEGAVPELKAKNMGDKAVLLLDGEEVAGAKQNRVLNATILIPAKAEVIIPVSCTEAGRWHYTSSEFEDSGNVMASQVRRQKTSSVTRRLEDYDDFWSDQGEVWDGIENLEVCLDTLSPTGAMSDIFESKGADLDACLEAFPCLPGQQGLLAMVNGEAVGMDVLSLASAYGLLHPKLLKSYAMEALANPKDKAPKAGREKAEAFLADARACRERKYKSVGMGWDYRYKSKKMVGSALLCRSKVVHTAFFKLEAAQRDWTIADLQSRRGYRL